MLCSHWPPSRLCLIYGGLSASLIPQLIRDMLENEVVCLKMEFYSVAKNRNCNVPKHGPWYSNTISCYTTMPANTKELSHRARRHRIFIISLCVFFFFGCHDQQAGEAFWLLIARLTIENHLMPVTEWHSHCQVRLVGSHRKCGQCYTGNLLTRNTARLGDLYSGTQESRCNKTNTYPTLDTFSFIHVGCQSSTAVLWDLLLLITGLHFR